MQLKPIINPKDVIAVGDIHGCYDLLQEFVETVRNTGAVVIFLGDIIDRGANDLEVVDKICDMTRQPQNYGLESVTCLRGNHEQMFIDAVKKPGSEFLLWIRNGGNFEVFGELQEYLEWMDELPIFTTIRDTLYIHGGCIPGQDPNDTIINGEVSKLMWIREPFTKVGPKLEEWSTTLKKVVFGHTPLTGANQGQTYDIPGGVCIDTGCYFTGKLTAYNTTQDSFLTFTSSSNVEQTAHR
jgi:serine/threonine protein phosphatase 1